MTAIACSAHEQHHSGSASRRGSCASTRVEKGLGPVGLFLTRVTFAVRSCLYPLSLDRLLCYQPWLLTQAECVPRMRKAGRFTSFWAAFAGGQAEAANSTAAPRTRGTKPRSSLWTLFGFPEEVEHENSQEQTGVATGSLRIDPRKRVFVRLCRVSTAVGPRFRRLSHLFHMD